MLRPCLSPGCPELVESGRCPRHAAKVRERIGKTAERGYGSDWRKVRLEVLARDRYECQIQTHCGRGVGAQDGALATEADHIIPIDRFPGGRLLKSNLQAACKACNVAKGDRFDPAMAGKGEGNGKVIER
jgi:5-methylcytosine-specific restriction protein A